VQKLKKTYSESITNRNISNNEAESMLQTIAMTELYKISGEFEQDRYQRATSMLDKCSQTGLIKNLQNYLTLTLISISCKDKCALSIHTLNAQLHTKRPEDAQLLEGCR
jgi:hypothetical protein